MDATSFVVIPSDPSAIADEINQLHRDAQEIAAGAIEQSSSAVEKAVECGVRLTQVKEQLLQHGEFMQWVEDNCEFGHRQATTYIKLSSNWNRASNLNNSSIRKALALIAPDPTKEKQTKEKPRRATRGNAKWPSILESFARRKSVSYKELAEAAGAKNDEKVVRYATQWQDASGLVIEKTQDGIAVKSGGDAVVAIFEKLPSKSKQVVLQKLHLDEEVVEKKFKEFKRGGKTVGDQVIEMLHSASNALHGVVQQYRGKEQSFSKVTEEQASELIRVHSLIESSVKDVEEILLKGISNGVSKK